MKQDYPLDVSKSGTFLLDGQKLIYRLGFGAMRLTGPGIWGDPPNREDAFTILRKAVEYKINFMDTADSYGPFVSEDIIKEGLFPYPNDLVIATKGGLIRPGPGEWTPLGDPKYLIQCVEMSLRRLNLKTIDLYQLHTVDPKVPLEESLKALKYMQQEGKIRFIGLSNVSVSEIERARKIVNVSSVQNLYNLKDRKSEDVLEYCEKNQIGFIPWYPLGSGNFVQKNGPLQKYAETKNATPSQIALAWLLKRSPVMLPIPGTANLKHLEENIGAANINLSDSDFAQISKL